MSLRLQSLEPDNMIKIPIIKGLIFILTTFYLEYYKYSREQPFIETVMNLCFHTVLYIVVGTYSVVNRNNIGTILLLFNIFETFCYHFTHSGINSQILMSMDFGYVWRNLRYLYILFPSIAILVFIVMRIPFYDSMVVSFKKIYLYILIISLVAPLLSVSYHLKINYMGAEKSMLNGQSTNSSIISFFAQEFVTAKRKNDRPLKNLIIFEIESMEIQSLGIYNPTIPKALPFISKLTKNSTFFSRMVPQIYTTWSVASTFAFHCGMPMILPYTNMDGNRMKIHLSKMHHCLGDYLHNAGYKLYSMMTKQFCGGFGEMLDMHHWAITDERYHKLVHDQDVLDIIIDKMLPEFATNESHQPFAIHVGTTDSHPPYVNFHKKCKNVLPECYTYSIRELDCYDQALREFFVKFEALGLHKNTVVIIYGDHPNMWLNGLKVQEPRYLPVIIPYRKAEEIDKDITIYDISHSIFDLLDLEVSPKFPFGASLFGNITGYPPDKEDFQLLFNIFRRTFMKIYKEGNSFGKLKKVDTYS